MTRQDKINLAIDWLYFGTLVFWGAGFYYMFIQELVRDDFFVRYFLDFARFYSTAQLGMSEQRLSLYDMQVQHYWLSKTVTDSGGVFPNVPNTKLALSLFMAEQPPPFFFIYMPFALMPLKPAFVSNMLVFFLFGASVTWALARLSGKLNRNQRLLIIFGGVVAGINAYGLQLGHAHWLVLALIGGFCYGLLSKSDIVAGVSLALLCIKPQYMIYLGLIPLVLRRVKIIAVTAITGIVLLIASILAFGPNNVWSYPAMVISHDMAPGFQTSMVSIRGLLDCLMGHDASAGLATVLTLGSLASIVWLWLKTPEDYDCQALAVSISVIVSLVFGPHNFRYDCLLFMIPAALLLPSVSVADALHRKYWDECVFFTALLVYPLATVGVIYVLKEQLDRNIVCFLLHGAMLVCLVRMWLRARQAVKSA